MIEFSLPVLFVLPMVGALCVIMACWIVYLVRHRVMPPSSQDRLYRCSACDHLYVDRRNVQFARCSLCAHLNEAIYRPGMD